MSLPPRRSPPTHAGIVLCVVVLGLVVLGLAACGDGSTRTGLPPEREWPHELTCPVSTCAGRTVQLHGTINEPSGTFYGVSGAADDVFLICRWPEDAAQPSCEPLPASGAGVVGEAAVYRADRS